MYRAGGVKGYTGPIGTGLPDSAGSEVYRAVGIKGYTGTDDWDRAASRGT